MDDEPLSEWAERHDTSIGRLRAVPLVTGDGPRGSHLNPDVPRAIQRWNGHLWEPYGFAANLAEAKRVLFPGTGATPAPGPAPKLGPGTGRHRKPPASREP
ncbi:DUF6087 family protein [Streptomyces lavenduligriseus]|uniref:DUF6087 family protein n=1 Tax=Streptomyces lavenduligriseus TaxID=67315 RepID=A0ABT0P4N2_9ACTN|nr:DUF6087 family protein [Streptomyces lavenduligriseus]MCL3998679.1 DUF6087 family protein [Streptomyces lavenduligriseus]